MPFRAMYSAYRVSAAALAAACLAVSAAAAPDKYPVIVVSAEKHAYHNAPVTAAIPTPTEQRRQQLSGYLMLTPMDDRTAKPIRAQAEIGGDTTRVTFILDDLPKGRRRTYRLGQIVFVRAPVGQVRLTETGRDVEVRFDKELFTRYTMKAAPNKPVFYPILAPDGTNLTRRWPVEPDADPNESHDHPHHRGLWFTHSVVNGVDFWSEQDAKVGKTITISISDVQSGWVYGAFKAKTEWRTSADQLIANDVREVHILKLPGGDSLLDFSVTLTPAGGPLTFGDNKDGVFGLRVPDSLAIQADRSAKIKGEGHIETASGASDRAAWGKPNDWVDYWGPIGGKTYGVAMLDAPTNLRHPETWHARDYALFTVNPFGLHDFGLGNKGAGDYTVNANGSINFTYRVIFHQGDTKTAGIADAYAAFQDPPTVTVR